MIEVPYWAIVAWVIGSGGAVLYWAIRDGRRLNAAEKRAQAFETACAELNRELVDVSDGSVKYQREATEQYNRAMLLQSALDRSNACANDLQDKLHLANKEIERLEGPSGTVGEIHVRT